MSETRTRFLREIAARIPPERLVEIHLFPPIRQGALESGMAVVAATPETPPPDAPSPGADALPPEATCESAMRPDGEQIGMTELLDAAAEDGAEAEPEPAEGTAEAREPIVRHTVYTARYRSTLKGPDRGKWEFSLVAEADAPLVTIDAVVRGVQRRSADAAEPERLTLDALRAMDEETWATSAA